jgi:hypothetical protein
MSSESEDLVKLTAFMLLGGLGAFTPKPRRRRGFLGFGEGKELTAMTCITQYVTKWGEGNAPASCQPESLGRWKT